ncbi:MAG TPA: PQQ-dependent sugar dehydrogenase [Rhodothermales bacterium]|nr:PQQ-dependent sugar dehydrogenase [Rhodothermales bacterium]
MLKRSSKYGTIVACAVVALSCASADVQPGGIKLEPAFSALTFNRPVDLQHTPDQSNRLFVIEQPGIIRVFENRPDVQSAPVFLDIRDRVLSEGNEQGLLGLAFHPDFQQNGYFYVDYTADNPQRTVIARYHVDPAHPDQADPASETVLLEVPQPFSNHNGGQVAFGSDGMLYVSFGDGGSGGDPHGNGQNPGTLLGSIIRIDVDHPSDGRPYGIPSDNPFADSADGARPEIYAYGLRNPWRFSFDAETGRMWAGDVGQNKFEEIDIIEKGKNYGWNVMEASSCFEPSEGCDRSGLTLPVFDYGRDLGACVTGGYVYHGQRAPALSGKYIFADYTSGNVWSLDYKGQQQPTTQIIVDSGLNIPSFGVDQNGELYVLAFDGKIYQFTPALDTSAQP